ncbi:MAG: matrixin family metalloprotease, partial [Deltaproteobacteria bacterium]
MGLRGTAVIALALVGFAASPPPAAAWTPYLTQSGTPLHWPTDTLHYAVASDLPEELTRAGVERVMADSYGAWATLSCQPFTTVFEGFEDGLPVDGADGLNALVWVPTEAAWSDLGYGATELARTGVTHRVNSGEIIDADIRVNAGGFSYSEATACAPDVYDLQATLTHELGHLFGLDHSADAAATMAWRTDPGVCDKRTLTQDDIDGFCATYEIYPIVEPEPEPEPTADVIGGDAIGSDVVEGRPPSRQDCAAGGSGGASLALA